MQVIEQSYEFVQAPPENALEIIERIGRVCYKSEDKRNGCLDLVKRRSCEMECESCESHSSYKFAQSLMRRKHFSVIEHVSASVKFITDRGVTHELVRHRLCSFSQESTRYVNHNGRDMEFIRPAWMPELELGHYSLMDIHLNPSDSRLRKERSIAPWLQIMCGAEFIYALLSTNGWRPEQARAVLPNSLKTEIVMTANLREWRHIFSLRCSNEAHPQMRELMRPLCTEMKKRVPVIFDDITW